MNYKLCFIFMVALMWTLFAYLTGLVMGIKSERKFNERSQFTIGNYYGNDEWAKGVAKYKGK